MVTLLIKLYADINHQTSLKTSRMYILRLYPETKN